MKRRSSEFSRGISKIKRSERSDALGPKPEGGKVYRTQADDLQDLNSYPPPEGTSVITSHSFWRDDISSTQ